MSHQRQVMFQVFKEVQHEYQAVPDGTATDLLELPSRLPVISCLGRTDCQGVDFESQWMGPEAGGIPGVSKRSLMNSKQLQMDLPQISSDSYLDSQFLVTVEN